MASRLCRGCAPLIGTTFVSIEKVNLALPFHIITLCSINRLHKFRNAAGHLSLIGNGTVAIKDCVPTPSFLRGLRFVVLVVLWALSIFTVANSYMSSVPLIHILVLIASACTPPRRARGKVVARVPRLMSVGRIAYLRDLVTMRIWWLSLSSASTIRRHSKN